MTEAVGYVVGVALSYLVGSVPFGYLVGRMGGIDIRRWGSGNVGATNVARVLGVRRGALVFALDALKGAGATGLVAGGCARIFGTDAGLLPVLCAAGVILGHTFTCWLKFKGGKGVATALGAWLVLRPVETLIALAVWGVVAAIWRYVSLASIVAAVAFPGVLVTFSFHDLRAALPQLVFAGLFSALVLVKHASNIVRLVRGTENKIGGVFAKSVRAPRPGGPSGEER